MSALEPGGVGVAHGMGDVAADRDADDPAPVAEHVPIAVGQTPPVGEDHLDRDPRASSTACSR